MKRPTDRPTHGPVEFGPMYFGSSGHLSYCCLLRVACSMLCELWVMTWAIFESYFIPLSAQRSNLLIDANSGLTMIVCIWYTFFCHAMDRYRVLIVQDLGSSQLMQDWLYFLSTIYGDRFATVLIRFMVCDRYCHIQVSSRWSHIDNRAWSFESYLTEEIYICRTMQYGMYYDSTTMRF